MPWYNRFISGPRSLSSSSEKNLEIIFTQCNSKIYLSYRQHQSASSYRDIAVRIWATGAINLLDFVRQCKIWKILFHNIGSVAFLLFIWRRGEKSAGEGTTLLFFVGTGTFQVTDIEKKRVDPVLSRAIGVVVFSARVRRRRRRLALVALWWGENIRKLRRWCLLQPRRQSTARSRPMNFLKY